MKGTVSVDEPKQYENVEPTLTPKEELRETLKMFFCRMQKVFCHHCKHELLATTNALVVFPS